MLISQIFWAEIMFNRLYNSWKNSLHRREITFRFLSTRGNPAIGMRVVSSISRCYFTFRRLIWQSRCITMLVKCKNHCSSRQWSCASLSTKNAFTIGRAVRSTLSGDLFRLVDRFVSLGILSRHQCIVCWFKPLTPICWAVLVTISRAKQICQIHDCGECFTHCQLIQYLLSRHYELHSLCLSPFGLENFHSLTFIRDRGSNVVKALKPFSSFFSA
jgi:hypothetical protein